MIPVREARRLVAENAPPRRVVSVPLLSALGGVLAEDVASDVDMPPFRRAQMDGYAVRALDLAALPAELRIVGEVFAGGECGAARVAAGTAVRIMTGAPVPEGADTVVQVEHTEPARGADGAVGGGAVRILKAPKPGANVVARAHEMAVGQRVLAAGTLLRPPELAVLACVGRAEVPVYRRPTVAVLTTGDELVAVGTRPTGAQIRDSNGYSVAAQVAAAGFPYVYLGTARDEKADLERKIAAGLEHDVLLVTGGVSVGEKDYVSGVLAAQGVATIFHNVNMKPGKPAWFGRVRDTLVFGLPGNPVSTMVCFELFVRTALAQAAGNPDLERRVVTARLAEPFGKTSDREQFHPARLTLAPDGTRTVAPTAWKGSADILGMTQANALLNVPAGSPPLPAGTTVEVIPIA
ncbi:MAG: molybdopterin molybdotransferase MoeA [Planctomycetes bacterium]|nr:molybdopterin molybdotransferase MoeA [Planctomycetota bacterium]